MACCYYSWAWKYLPAFLELVDQSISPGHGQRRPRTLGQVPSCWNAIKLPWFGESQVQVHQERTWPFPSFLFLFFPFFFFFFWINLYNVQLFSLYLGFPRSLISVPLSFFFFFFFFLFFGSQNTLPRPGSPEYLDPTRALEHMLNLRHVRSPLRSEKYLSTWSRAAPSSPRRDVYPDGALQPCTKLGYLTSLNACWPRSNLRWNTAAVGWFVSPHLCWRRN